MIVPGQHHHDEHDDRHPAKPDRWLVGLLAGAALMYLAGKLLGLGKPRRATSDQASPRASRATP